MSVHILIIQQAEPGLKESEPVESGRGRGGLAYSAAARGAARALRYTE